MPLAKDREDEAAELATYFSKFSAALTRLEEELGRWKNYEADYEALKTTLLDLPKETSHSVMVPFGNLAFMPGKLIHTNEVLVMLGDNWFVDRSAVQAAEIVDRRMEYVQENITKLKTQEDALRNKSGMAPGLLGGQEYNEEGLPIVEITEPYFSDEEEPIEKKGTPLLPYSQKTAKEQAEDQAILKRLAELEREDEERERRREAGEIVTSDEETESEPEEEHDDGASEDEFRPKALDSDEEYEEEVWEHSGNEQDEEDEEHDPKEGGSSEKKAVRFADQVAATKSKDGAPGSSKPASASKPKSPADLFNQMRARQQAVRSSSGNEQMVNMATLESTFAGLTGPSVLGKAPVFEVQEKPTELKSALKPTPKKTSLFKQARKEQVVTTPSTSVVAPSEPAPAPVKKLSKFALARLAASSSSSSSSEQGTPGKPAPSPARMGVSDFVMEREIVPPTLPASMQPKPEETASTSGSIAGFKDVIENTFTKPTAASEPEPQEAASGGRRKKSLFRQQQTQSFMEPEPAVPGSSFVDETEVYASSSPRATVPEVVSRTSVNKNAASGSVVERGAQSVVTSGKLPKQGVPIAPTTSRTIPVVASAKLRDTALMKGAIVEHENIEPVDEDELEDDMLMRQVVSEYQERRQAMIAKHGAFTREGIESMWEQQVVIPEGMVIPEPEIFANAEEDDEADEDNEEGEDEDDDGEERQVQVQVVAQESDDRNERPKKLSLFRAARLTGSLAKQPRE
ncbi:uri1, prefoldin-like chaperone [Mortierella antarctica]|nr:uri1, prefoldin-like chaperone [Mortierella antarctica]